MRNRRTPWPALRSGRSLDRQGSPADDAGRRASRRSTAAFRETEASLQLRAGLWGAASLLPLALAAVPFFTVVPLKPPDPDVLVDLQAVFRQAYQRGRYARSLRYRQAPRAPLSEKDRRWAMEQKPG